MARWAGAFSLALVSFSSLAASGTMLSRDVVVPLAAVVQHFPDVSRAASPAPNPTATGNPEATVMVIYADEGAAKKVTITVDRYRSARDAASAYRQAVRKSRSVRGFKPMPVPDIGRKTFAGTVTLDAETHIGAGVLQDRSIVGVTLAGFAANPENLAKLVSLARLQASLAKKAAR